MATECAEYYQDQVMFRYGTCGYWLYYQLHTNKYNQLVHALIMPLTAYGALLMVAGAYANMHIRKYIMQGVNINHEYYTVNRSTFPPYLIPYIVLWTYTLYYLTFDVLGALFTCMYYLPSVYLAADVILAARTSVDRDTMTYVNAFREGLLMLIVGVVLQEVFGHLLFEYSNSDLRQIANSIAIAPYFAANVVMKLI